MDTNHRTRFGGADRGILVLDADYEENTMSNITSAQPAPQTEAEYEAVFERVMVEAQSIADNTNEQVRRDRSEIDLLKAETKTIRDETRPLLAGIDATQAQWEQRRDRDIAACDQKNIILRAENDRLRSARGLPPYGGSRLF